MPLDYTAPPKRFFILLFFYLIFADRAAIIRTRKRCTEECSLPCSKYASTLGVHLHVQSMEVALETHPPT
jgi:hypothetical protein